ncbi:MAG: hypothetical protein QOH96_1543 [Blastocatellia bacterium]|nr:hypothetical protein [Blastocatellia bacterium]
MSVPDAGESRQAPRRLARHEVCLNVSLSLFDTQTGIADARKQQFILYGTTHDLSDSGVAVVITNVKIDQRFFEEAHLLPLTLFLPNGQVQMEISPVRYNLLNAVQPDEGFFIGAKLSRISDDQRAILRQYFDTP